MNITVFEYIPAKIRPFPNQRLRMPLFAVTKSEGFAPVTLAVPGMTCLTCPVTIKKALMKEQGVASVTVRYEKKELIVSFDDAKTIPDAFMKSLLPSNRAIEVVTTASSTFLVTERNLNNATFTTSCSFAQEIPHVRSWPRRS